MEHPQVADLSNMFQKHALVAYYGNLAEEQPLLVDLSIAPWLLISATLHRITP